MKNLPSIAKQRRSITTRLFFFPVMIFSLSAIAGCAMQLDPDVMRREALPSAQTRVVYMKISGTLDGPNGDPIHGAKVVAQTYQGKWTDITTHRGTFRIEAIKSEGESIDFHFTPSKETSHPANVKWTVTIFDQDIPKGVERITAHFFVDKLGSVRLASMEY